MPSRMSSAASRWELMLRGAAGQISMMSANALDCLAQAMKTAEEHIFS